MPRDWILGTDGQIDHGKTVLVKVVTGLVFFALGSTKKIPKRRSLAPLQNGFDRAREFLEGIEISGPMKMATRCFGDMANREIYKKCTN